MSFAALVSYGNSSDENSDSEAEISPKPTSTLTNKTENLPNSVLSETTSDTVISDDDCDVISNSNSLNLPAPKMTSDTCDVEEDDEFLYKKLLAIEKPPPPPKTMQNRKTVQIILPSMSQYNDVNSTKRGPMIGAQAPAKLQGLLHLLPKPKMDRVFNKKSSEAPPKSLSTFVPHCLANKSKKLIAHREVNKLPNITVETHCSDSSDSDQESDFFSLNSENKLPEVSDIEITTMVANKTAQISKRPTSIKDESHLDSANLHSSDNIEASYSGGIEFDARAIQALVGSRAKRARMEQVNVIDLSSDQILPNQDEWLRTAVQSSTEYIPRGMVSEEATPGTRRKHQITYLAHMAKTNEQELQAMWAANRHTKRQTQSKYGF